MKTKPIQRQDGNVLIIALVTTALAGFVLGSFLFLTSIETRGSARSQSWNLTIPVLEAGVEESLAHLNNNVFVDDLNREGRTSPQWTADGWSAAENGNGIYKKTTFPDGSFYEVTVLTNSPDGATQEEPSILSEGHVAMSKMVLSRSDLIFATIGVSNMLNSANMVRKVKVKVKNPTLFFNGLAAKDRLQMNGNGLMSDSYNSSDPNLSTNGLYDPNRSGSAGDIAAGGDGITNAVVDTGNHSIQGHVSVSPGGQIFSGGKIGDKAWQASGSGIQPGWTNDDLNVSFPDVKVPFAGGYSTYAASGVATNYSVSAIATNITVAAYPVGKTDITTNYVTLTSSTYPNSPYGPVTTNTTLIEKGSYPAAPYTGVVWTNILATNSPNFPSSYLGGVTTNALGWITVGSPPPAGTYNGLLQTNWVATNAPAYPGSSVGLVTTNAGPSVTSGALPAASAHFGAIITNKTLMPNMASVPAGALGPIRTNPVVVTTITHHASQKPGPAPGQYVPGTLVAESGNKFSWDSASYTTNYTYDYYVLKDYTYNPPNYSWPVIASYSYQGRTFYYQILAGYDYRRIDGYTYAGITGYTYIDRTNVTNVISTASYDYILDGAPSSGLYKLTSLSGTGLVRGQVTVWVTDSLSLGAVTIAPGGCLKIYSGVPSVSMAGNGTVNQPGYATNFFFFGLPSCTSVTLSGNAGFTGCIYAPNADLRLNGGGNNRMDFMGAGVFKSVTMNGHFGFHYDEALRDLGPRRGYTVDSWTEVSLDQNY